MNNVPEKVKELAHHLHLPLQRWDLYQLAFTHQSYANEHHEASNERLEYLGDAILDFLVAEFLYHRYPDLPEGQLTKIRAKYVCANANSKYAQALKLDRYLLLGKGELEQGGKSKPSVLADLFEAFLGALYLDLGIEVVRSVLEKYVFNQIETMDTGFFVDYKSRLQEFVQAESREGVRYVLQEASGLAHDKTFRFAVFHENLRLGVGVGKSKKEAQQNAAKDALEKLALN
ncbi:MAG TPA: ribonuclease III [Bacilli bacterium]|nr:MAG: Ribonuclease 3 [Tenericutes bacterium ADurb.BinA124]HNZ50078.1 ribonuclease III [Bacilli bacterium]HOH17751.1 ribonuclease III [Bacilli bacterium]HPX83943.1 ribonuclease III [Bacilli bacterium]HQC74496.1 ribonuclease III [Bacilli bacterium]